MKFMPNLSFLPPLGLRNIKTAIAVLLCLGFGRLLGLPSVFYACIAAVITMQPTVESSLQKGIHRMFGTLIGAGFGILFSSIRAHDLLLTAVGVVLVIYVTNAVKLKESINIACVLFLAIMINLKDKTPLAYSTDRVVETLLGIAIAVTVNTVLFPPAKEQNSDD